MRKITAGLFLSLDGVTESPEKWTFPYFSDEVGKVIQASMDASDTMLLGRRTYEEFGAYWPTAEDPMADYMNNVPTVVVSTSLTRPTWGKPTVIGNDGADVVAQLRTIKQKPGRNLAITGSVSLVRYLLRRNLLDELTLMVFPIVVGRGKRLFLNTGGQLPLTLASCEKLSTGVVSLTYHNGQ